MPLALLVLSTSAPEGRLGGAPVQGYCVALRSGVSLALTHLPVLWGVRPSLGAHGSVSHKLPPHA